MLQLEQLVRNQHFLVTVIDTMERQKDFSVRDRSVRGYLVPVYAYLFFGNTYRDTDLESDLLWFDPTYTKST